MHSAAAFLLASLIFKVLGVGQARLKGQFNGQRSNGRASPCNVSVTGSAGLSGANTD